MFKANKSLATPAIVFPMIIWVAVILYYSVNLPWYDDFDPFPDFLNKWIAAQSAGERLTILFQPNNEHRMVISKLLTLSYFWVTGHLNFTYLHIAGACFTFGTVYLFWKSFKTTRLSNWYFVPVAFFLFQLQYHLVFLWAICSHQHQTVVFFVSLTMFLLSKDKNGWALLSGICATYSMSNGIFVWPAAFVVLLLTGRYRWLIVWVVTAVIAVGFYFYGLSAQGNESSFAFFAKYPHLSVLGFFAFLGGLFDLVPEKDIVVRSVLPVIMGLFVMVWVTIWLLRLLVPAVQKMFRASFRIPAWLDEPAFRNPPQIQLFLTGIMMFLLANAFIIGLLRPRFGFFVMVVSNYKLYPALFLAIAYLAWATSPLREKSHRNVYRIGLAASVFIWVASALTYLPIIAERSKYLTVNGYNQEFNGYGLGHVPFSPAAQYVDNLMKKMVAPGIYQYPEKGNVLAEKAKATKIARHATDETVKVEGDHILVRDANARISLSRDRGSYAFFRNPARIYIFKLEPRRYVGRNFLKQYDKGMDIAVPKSSLLPGEYEAGVMEIVGGEVADISGREIVVP